MERLSDTTYVIVTNDGPDREDVFLSWTSKEGGYYTTVEYIDEMSELDFFDTVEAAIERAKEVNSSTFGGWNWAPMKIMELTNFYNAYYNNEYPELVEVQVLSFCQIQQVTLANLQSPSSYLVGLLFCKQIVNNSYSVCTIKQKYGII